MACGQCELQGVGRQVWLCLTGVGSQRNLAQRGPGWLGERELPACRRSSQPLRGGAWRTAGPRTRLSPRRYMSPASQAPSFCHSPRSLARQGREKRARVGGGGTVSASGLWVLPGNEHTPQGRACNRSPATDAGAAARRRVCTAEAGTPPNSIVCVRWTRRIAWDRWCLPRSAGASGSSPGSGVSLCGCHRL